MTTRWERTPTLLFAATVFSEFGIQLQANRPSIANGCLGSVVCAACQIFLVEQIIDIGDQPNPLKLIPRPNVCQEEVIQPLCIVIGQG